MKKVAGLDTRQLGELKAWLEPWFGSSRGNRRGAAAAASGISVTDGTTTVAGATGLSLTGAAVSNPGGGIAGIANDWRFLAQKVAPADGASKLEFTSINRLYKHLLVVARLAYDDSVVLGAGVTDLKVSTNYTGGWNWQSFNDYVQDHSGLSVSPVIIPNLVVGATNQAGLGDAFGFAYFYFPYYTDAAWIPSFMWDGAAPDVSGTVGMHMLTGAANGGWGAGFDTFTNKITFDIGAKTYAANSTIDLYAAR